MDLLLCQEYVTDVRPVQVRVFYVHLNCYIVGHRMSNYFCQFWHLKCVVLAVLYAKQFIILYSSCTQLLICTL